MKPYSDIFNSAVTNTLNYEGGYANNPKDPGGETNFGISKRAYPNIDIKNLTKEKAIDIYYHDYWLPIHGDEMLPSLAYNVFDMAVNAGVGTAIRMLQNALVITSDGKIGPNTLSAMKSANSAHLTRFGALRAQYYFSLSTYAIFGKGWIIRTFGTLINSLK